MSRYLTRSVSGTLGAVPRTRDPRDLDEVDAIVAAWRRERPDLDVTPLEVLSRLSRLARRLDLTRASVFADHDLDGWEFDVLSALRRAGEPHELSPGELVRATLVTSGTMTNRVDRLVERGLVERHRSETDRRGVRVRITPTGLARLDAAFADLLDREHELLAELPETDRVQLASLLRGLLQPLEERAAR